MSRHSSADELGLIGATSRRDNHGYETDLQPAFNPKAQTAVCYGAVCGTSRKDYDRDKVRVEADP
jgi:hypothetical protein